MSVIPTGRDRITGYLGQLAPSISRHPHAKSRSSNSTSATSMATVLYIMQYNNAQARYAKGTGRPAEIGA